MGPLLDGDETRTVETDALAPDDGHCGCIIPFGVLRTIFVAGEIQAWAVLKGVDHVLQAKASCKNLTKLACQMYQLATVIPTEPTPQREGRGWDLQACYLVTGRGSQSGNIRAKGKDQRPAQADDDSIAIGELLQRPQRLRRIRIQSTGEDHISRLSRHRSENS
jgi:hypothetical protein